MKIVDATMATSSPNPHHVDARKLCEIPHAVVVMITLQPGESLKRHMTPVDVLFYVLEGTGTVEIGEERETVGPDSLIESPARIPHHCSRLHGKGQSKYVTAGSERWYSSGGARLTTLNPT